jgi:hypothetical protein
MLRQPAMQHSAAAAKTAKNFFMRNSFYPNPPVLQAATRPVFHPAILPFAKVPPLPASSLSREPDFI